MKNPNTRCGDTATREIDLMALAIEPPPLHSSSDGGTPGGGSPDGPAVKPISRIYSAVHELIRICTLGTSSLSKEEQERVSQIRSPKGLEDRGIWHCYRYRTGQVQKTFLFGSRYDEFTAEERAAVELCVDAEYDMALVPRHVDNWKQYETLFKVPFDGAHMDAFNARRMATLAPIHREHSLCAFYNKEVVKIRKSLISSKIQVRELNLVMFDSGTAQQPVFAITTDEAVSHQKQTGFLLQHSFPPGLEVVFGVNHIGFHAMLKDTQSFGTIGGALDTESYERPMALTCHHVLSKSRGPINTGPEVDYAHLTTSSPAFCQLRDRFIQASARDRETRSKQRLHNLTVKESKQAGHWLTEKEELSRYTEFYEARTKEAREELAEASKQLISVAEVGKISCSTGITYKAWPGTSDDTPMTIDIAVINVLPEHGLFNCVNNRDDKYPHKQEFEVNIRSNNRIDFDNLEGTLTRSVFMKGATSGVVRGQINGVRSDVLLDKEAGIYTSEMCVIAPFGEGFSREGDSGSFVYMKDGTLAGMCIGGGSHFMTSKAYVTPAWAVREVVKEMIGEEPIVY